MTEKKESSGLGETIGIGMFATIFLASLMGNLKSCKYEKDLEKIAEKYNPNNIQLEYINNDSLPDLVYKTGEIYLQTKQGNFVSYEEVLQKEKAKLDSVYQAKQDSLREVFENKLERGVK